MMPQGGAMRNQISKLEIHQKFIRALPDLHCVGARCGA
jgi:hypothetical protein